MADQPRQLTLDLPVATQLDAEDFLVGPANTDAFTMVESWPAWPDKLLCLTGPEGSGKTHLAAIWAARSGAVTIAARDVHADNIETLSAADALVLEDADPGPVDEHALFHLLNAMRGKGAWLLITARRAPDAWGLVVPDLLSRLRLAPMVTIAPPDDALLRAVLVKLFHDRQLIVDAPLVEVLCKHMERSLANALRLVEALDREALSLNKRITRALALSILSRLEGTDDADAVEKTTSAPDET